VAPVVKILAAPGETQNATAPEGMEPDHDVMICTFVAVAAQIWLTQLVAHQLHVIGVIETLGSDKNGLG
jgi:hypothetical protein